MFEINEKDFSIDVKESLTWDGSVIPVLNEIKDEIENWYERNSEELIDGTEEDLENCKYALDAIESGFGEREKIVILSEIVNYYEEVTYRDDVDISIFSYDIIEEAIYRFIEEEFEFDARS